MDSLVPRPSADPRWDNDTVDPVDLVAERLMTGGTAPLSVDFWDRLGCPGETVPAPQGRAAYHAAVLAALAARHLLAPEVVTASIIGPGSAVQLHTIIFARYVPWVSLVSVFLTDRSTAAQTAADEQTNSVRSVFDARTVDELDLAGITLARAASPAESVFGANLVVVIEPAGTDDGARGPDTPLHLAKGALLVNASGRDLPPALAAQLSQVFVDDLSLIDRAAAHGLAGPARALSRTHPQPRYRLVGDLRQVVLGEHVGRTDQEQVLLVELLSSASSAPC